MHFRSILSIFRVQRWNTAVNLSVLLCTVIPVSNASEIRQPLLDMNQKVTRLAPRSVEIRLLHQDSSGLVTLETILSHLLEKYPTNKYLALLFLQVFVSLYESECMLVLR